MAAESPVESLQEELKAHLKTLREEREKLLGRKTTAEGKSQEYLKWTQAERQMIVAEFQQLRQFLEEQEQLLLAQLQKLDEEVGRLQTDTVRRLSAQISHFSEQIVEVEGMCQKLASEFLQDIRNTLTRHSALCTGERKKKIPGSFQTRLQNCHVCLQLSPWPAEPGTGNGCGGAVLGQRVRHLLSAGTEEALAFGQGFPVSKAHARSWVEREEEMWIPGLQGCEEGESIRHTHTAGDEMLSENNEESLQQEAQEQITPHEMCLGGSEGHVSQICEQGETCKSQHSPDRHMGNHSEKGQGESSHRSRGMKGNIETIQQKIPLEQALSSYNDCATLIEHQRIHTMGQTFYCSDCGKSFSRRSNLSRHQKIHTAEPRLSSADCGRSFSESSDLVRHRRIHTEEKTFICSDCGESFRWKSHLNLHRRIHTGEKSFICSDCGKSFGWNSHLNLHRRIHTGEKPYSCSDCGKSFRGRTHLLNHMTIHTGEKPFSCSDCGKSYCRRSYLVVHKRIHTGEKPFNCSDCGKSFSTSSYLVIHKRIHTGEKPFNCSNCGESFSNSSHLVRHSRIHTGEKP
ncbi:uncharacterized protein LOC142821441 isoform X7 [Pelodiscus sinensis]|uniref:uncharacterized protein LOC142821441 isoform X7 n=1 Tax=Pelodiscus sinensis TaxID=13735 RepID=UPI003F6D0650